MALTEVKAGVEQPEDQFRGLPGSPERHANVGAGPPIVSTGRWNPTVNMAEPPGSVFALSGVTQSRGSLLGRRKRGPVKDVSISRPTEPMMEGIASFVPLKTR